mmetsp:Transcript_15922/g.15336  ORF Transcript_15922/g.15336 Transcript_15922/m.15336 type:complete len:187 (-) Transcript_15922:68-628(-)
MVLFVLQVVGESGLVKVSTALSGRRQEILRGLELRRRCLQSGLSHCMHPIHEHMVGIETRHLFFGMLLFQVILNHFMFDLLEEGLIWLVSTRVRINDLGACLVGLQHHLSVFYFLLLVYSTFPTDQDILEVAHDGVFIFHFYLGKVLFHFLFFEGLLMEILQRLLSQDVFILERFDLLVLHILLQG